MELCVHIRILINLIRTHRLYWLAAVDFASDYLTLHLNARYRTMFGGGGVSEWTAPIVEVAFQNGTWWSIPQETSAQLYEQYVNNLDAVYTYDWGEGGRTGSWSPGGESTHINRYRIDFVARVQTNLDNQRKRSIRIIWVRLKMSSHNSQVNCQGLTSEALPV